MSSGQLLRVLPGALLKNMVIASLILSFITAFTGFLLNGELVFIISYGIIIPLLILLPRIITKFDKKLSAVIIKKKWLKKVDFYVFFIILFNAPGSLVFHELGFQYDRFLHLGTAFFAALILLLILLPSAEVRKKKIKKSSLLLILFTILFFSLFLWEAFQYTSDQIFGTKLFFDVKQPIELDFGEDIFFGFLGLMIAIFYISHSFKQFSNILRNSIL